MNKLSIIISSLIILSLFACNKKKVQRVFNHDNPYSIEIKKERSYFQAKKINDRLLGMDISTFMIYQEDSVDGNWFKVLSGAENISDSIDSYQTMLKSYLKSHDLPIVHFDSLENFKIIVDGDTSIIKETQKIDANKPDLPISLFQIAQQYPQSNALFLSKIIMLNLDKKIGEIGQLIASSTEFDLPRGISINKIQSHCFALSEAVFEDNLFDDLVTMHIARLKPVVNEKTTASLINLNNKTQFETAELFANLILETGEYLREEKEEIEIQAAKKLYGYKVLIEPKKDYLRTYYVLVDENTEFLFFTQSTDKTDDELIAILKQIGNSQGLNDYDEYYNAFYTLPDKLDSNDQFISFILGKLDWNYAKDRGYARWATKMVGHWDAMGYFYNKDKGIWSFSLFDMLTTEKQEYIYGTLYSKHSTAGKYQRQFYGTNGYAVYQQIQNWYTNSTEEILSEINFGKDRYVFAIGNFFESEFTEKDLTTRAESMQFKKGGYIIANK